MEKIPSVKSMEKTLHKIINDKCSVSRYGDGEFTLIFGKSITFQPYSEELCLRLKEILISNNENHIVCLPDIFNSLDTRTDESIRFWSKFLGINRDLIYKVIDINKDYYNAQITRPYIAFKNKGRSNEMFNMFKNIWSNKDILIIEGEYTRFGFGNDLLDNCKSIKRILCPSKNAFEKYNKILQEIKKQKKSTLILIALGPTATVLSYDLALEGYQAIDIGHLDIEYEWFLMKISEKCVIKNKYVNEVKNGNNNIQEIKDTKYINEIICKI